MRVSIIKIGEPLPIDDSARLFRCGILAAELIQRGHEVDWWTSTFDHFTRSQRHTNDQLIEVEPGYSLRMLYAPGYQNPVSLARVRHHSLMAKRLKSSISEAPKPDIILCSYPIVEMANVTLRYAKLNNIPAVIDVRDHWPDLYLKIVPPFARRLVKAAMWHSFSQRDWVLRQATHLTAISEKQLHWALEAAGRQRTANDRIFYHGYPGLNIPEKQLDEARNYWSAQGIKPDDFNVCFFGAIGRQSYLETIIKAAKVLSNSGRQDVRFILCGNGGKLKEYRQMTKNMNNVLLPGWIDSSQIKVLMQWSKIGLAPYGKEESYALPNKPFEYFYGGLPILSTVSGELQDILTQSGAGTHYQAESVDSFIRAFKQIYQDPNLQIQMAENAARLHRERFSTEHIYPAMAEYLEMIESN